jgi:class 3 adenylate cyclase
MFTDIVGSTEIAVRLGDARWGELLRRHDALVREEVAAHGGRVVKSLGDGALTVFDGPSRAMACAVAVGERARELGLRLRAGVHAGECELLGEDIAGIAVHIAARIAALAEAGEVLASGTVRDLSVGSSLALESRGEQMLKGVQEPWRGIRSGSGRRRGLIGAHRNLQCRPGFALPWPQASDGRNRWGPHSRGQPGSGSP